MTFEFQPQKSKKELLEEEKASLLKQLGDLDEIDQDSLEREDVRLESEILLVKEKLADFGLAGGSVKSDYDSAEFSPVEQAIIERLLKEKQKLIEERKGVREFLTRGKDEIQSELLGQLFDVQSKLKDL
ncbi:MAG: hypothetical protein K9M36_03575 [Candidatus Pacebacteria bacterium]|nr:hypothetical protein [Candidatus Paceibacterota bacterium]